MSSLLVGHARPVPFTAQLRTSNFREGRRLVDRFVGSRQGSHQKTTGEHEKPEQTYLYHTSPERTHILNPTGIAMREKKDFDVSFNTTLSDVSLKQSKTKMCQKYLVYPDEWALSNGNFWNFQGKGGESINVVSKKKLSQTPENYAKLRYNSLLLYRFSRCM